MIVSIWEVAFLGIADMTKMLIVNKPINWDGGSACQRQGIRYIRLNYILPQNMEQSG